MVHKVSFITFVLGCALLGHAVPVPSGGDSSPTVLGIAGAALDPANQALVDAQWAKVQSHVLNGNPVPKALLTIATPKPKERKKLTLGRHLASSWFAVVSNQFDIAKYKTFIPSWSVATFSDAQTSIANVPFNSANTATGFNVGTKSLFVDSSVNSFGFTGKWNAAKVESVCKATFNVGLVSGGSAVPQPPPAGKGYTIDATSLGLGKLCMGFNPSSCFPVSVRNTAAAAGDECNADPRPVVATAPAVPVAPPATGQTGAASGSTSATTPSAGTKRPAGGPCTGTPAKKAKTRRSLLDIVFRRATKVAASTIDASCSVPTKGKASQTSTVASKGKSTSVKSTTGKTVPVKATNGKVVPVKSTKAKTSTVKTTKAKAPIKVAPKVKTTPVKAKKVKAVPVKAKTVKKVKA
jgi:hypothetical protein